MVGHVLQLELSARCAPRRVLMHLGPCSLLLKPTSEERTSIQNWTHILQIPIQVMKAAFHYTTVTSLACRCLCLLAKEAACRIGPSHKNACLRMQRHEQVTTAEHKNVTAWEVKSEANRYAGLLQPSKSFQLHQQPPLESKRKKGARLAWDCMSRPSSPMGFSSSQAISSNLFGSCSNGWSRTGHGQTHHHI